MSEPWTGFVGEENPSLVAPSGHTDASAPGDGGYDSQKPGGGFDH